MSLIVARKDGNKIGIVSDTKLTYPNHEIKKSKTSPSEGVIKTIILTESLCISFAGEIEHAENAFKHIGSNFEVPYILASLETFHHLSEQKTEFIHCIGKPNLTFYKIKNGEVKETNQSWIGDINAFENFQNEMIAPPERKQPEKIDYTSLSIPKTNQPSITINEMNLSIEVDQKSSSLSKLSSAMDSVIENGNIDSVGGFKVNVIYDDKFFYNAYIKSYRQNVTMIGYGTQAIGHGTANDGSYSINFFGGSSDLKSVALHISQGNFGIVYNRVDNGLLRPIIFSMDEVDFIDKIQDKFNLIANLSTQDKVPKYFIKASNLFNQKKYRESELYFDKGFNAAKGAQKANFLFNKGVVLLNLEDKKPAMDAFTKTIKMDPSYTARIMNLLHPKRGNR